MPKIVVHVGLMKAASTTLQRLASASNALVTVHAAIATWEKETKRGRGARSFADVVGHVKGNNKPALITSESLHTMPWRKFGREVATALPGAEILLITRNPIDYIRSSYQKQIRSGYTGTVIDFATERADQIRRAFDFDGMTEAYANCGLKTHLLPMEMLQRDPRAFFAALEEILTVDLLRGQKPPHANRSPSFRHLEMVRAANSLFAAMLRGTDQWEEYQRSVYSWTSRLARASMQELYGVLPVRRETEFKAELASIDRCLFSQRMTCLGSQELYAPYIEIYGIMAQAPEPLPV